MKQILNYAAGITIMAGLVMSDASAVNLETLMMPGKVIEGHAKYEEKCDSCHQPFSKDRQDTLCRNCHEDVDADIVNETGLHGRSRARETECRHCHTDHKGRDRDIVQLDSGTLDHESTDYPLRGAHTTASCGACHVDGDKYRDAPVLCSACHEADDIHSGTLGDQCADCHTEGSWQRTDFDHDNTDFVLREKHAELECNSCHINEQYKDTVTQCHGCHSLNDVHAGRYGNKCGDCHTEEDWTQSRFDHRRDTRYPLTGRHRREPCDACHTGELYREKLKTDCIACHRNDDEHSGRYGNKCGSCHTNEDWQKAKYDHNSKTEYPLRGKHEDVACTACHRGDVYSENLKTDCYSCHVTDDVHKGQEGQLCHQCHDEHGWSERIRFEHDMADFPLIGLHAATPCEECHINARFKTAATECHACHQSGDVHEQQLGPDCERCHNPNGWSLWEFEHDLLTDFPLDGAHEGIDCLLCHDSPAAHGVQQSASCADCHRQDDVHDGQFGRNCERCHNTESFDAVQVWGP